MQVDHLVWAAPALDPACALFAQKTGITPQLGGVHGHGLSHNALVALGPRCYLEIYAPLPGKTDGDHWIRACAAMEAPQLFAVCIDAGAVLDTASTLMRKAGLDGDGPSPWCRTKPDGTVLNWRLFDPFPSRFGAALPFFIDWQQTPHPALTAPQGLSLAGVEITTPLADELDALFAQLGLDGINVRQGPAPAITALLDTPKGRIPLT